MYLLDAKTKKLEEFVDPPEYAILSHRWRQGEVLFADIHQLHHAKAMKGYAKIEGCCEQAQRDGYQYVWIDTCCIDKNSSAALAEAINSMYMWYENAQVCYAYLDDVPDNEDPGTTSAFAKSEWFKRGWTLQELIAPSSLFFFDVHWREIGSKRSLAGLLSSITRVHTDVLTRVIVQADKLMASKASFSVATKMSWAAGRKTTRPEDRAYSLMGIFNVHMPVIYGEGESKAFFRLQLEIMRLSHAQSILAWSQPVRGGTSGTWPFALSPDYFAGSSNVEDVPSGEWISYSQKSISEDVIPRLDFSATNDGLDISLPLRPLEDEDDKYIALLSCRRRTNERECSFIGICLRRSTHNAERYERINHHTLEDIVDPAGEFKFKNIHISFPLSKLPGMLFFPVSTVLFVQSIGVNEHGFDMMDVKAALGYERRERSIILKMKRPFPSVGSSRLAWLTYHNSMTKETFVVTLGVSWERDGGPWFQVSSEKPRDIPGQLKVDWTSYQLSAGRKVTVSLKKGGNASVGEKHTSLIERYSVNITIYG